MVDGSGAPRAGARAAAAVGGLAPGGAGTAARCRLLLPARGRAGTRRLQAVRSCGRLVRRSARAEDSAAPAPRHPRGGNRRGALVRAILPRRTGKTAHTVFRNPDDPGRGRHRLGRGPRPGRMAEGEPRHDRGLGVQSLHERPAAVRVGQGHRAGGRGPRAAGASGRPGSRRQAVVAEPQRGEGFHVRLAGPDFRPHGGRQRRPGFLDAAEFQERVRGQVGKAPQ